MAKSNSDSFNFFLPITKVQKNSDGTCLVSGYASTPALDMDGEIVSLDAVKSALPGYMAWRNVREMHKPSAVGVAKEANVDTKGLFLTAKISDREAAQKCIDEVYKGFSIGGRKLAKNGNTITEIDLVEISVVDRPANPECKFEVQKRASPTAGAYLVKPSKPFRDPKDTAIGAMAKAVKALNKAGLPNLPAAPDGFSRPAKVACKKHGVMDCAKCAMKVAKRDVSSGERTDLASQGNALPDGSFPIKNKDDLANARQAIGRSKNPESARKLIRRRASELGVKLPDTWSKKLAKRLIADAETEFQKISLKAIEAFDLHKGSVSLAEPSFLTLSASSGGGISAEGNPDAAMSLDLGSDTEKSAWPRKDGFAKGEKKFLKREIRKVLFNLDSEEQIMPKPKEVSNSNSPTLDQVLGALAKRGSVPSKAQRFQMARSNMKKASGTRKECVAEVEKVHKLLKAAYLSKLAKTGGKKPDMDADDFDMQKAMEGLQKVYGGLSTMKTFMKAASVNMKKAAGRTGQSGQEVSDAKDGFYEVPRGIKDKSPSEMSREGPGTTETGSAPPIDDMISVFPGKAAKIRKNGFISTTEAEAIARAAAAEAQVEILSKMPAAPVNGRRPASFDTTKLFAENNGRDVDSLMKNVDPNGLRSDDEEIRKASVGRLIGNMVIGGHGRSIMDPNFHGTAGGGRNN